MKRLHTLMFLTIAVTMPVLAGAFVNGGFETGNFTGWTQGGGYWGCCGSPGTWPMNPTNWMPGGPYYDMFGNRSAIVTVGTDPITGLPMVHSGSYAARVNDSTDSYHVSVISQTVVNYTDPNIYFAWAAVLEASHTATDSDNFSLKLTDDTMADTLYALSYSSASTPGYFHQAGSWYYSDWIVANLDVSARVGHTFTLTLLGADCPYGGHGGYVYLDGFGAAPPGVPEPSTLGLMALGVVGLVAFRLRKR